MLSSAGSLLVTQSAARQPGPTFVLQPLTGPSDAYSYNILLHLHAKRHTQRYKMSVSALYLNALVSNDSAYSVAIFKAYLYFCGNATITPRQVQIVVIFLGLIAYLALFSV